MDKIKAVIISIMMASLIKFVTYNPEGLSPLNRELIHDLLDDERPAVCFLQETWLFKKNLDSLNSLHDDYLGTGRSAIPDTEILQGRPYGGVGILWNQSLAKNVKRVDINSDRICAITLSIENCIYLIVNVYMPVDNRSLSVVSPEFANCIDLIEIAMHEVDYDSLVIGGDINTDLSRNNAQTKYLKSFLERNGLVSCWNHITDSYTYVDHNGSLES